MKEAQDTPQEREIFISEDIGIKTEGEILGPGQEHAFKISLCSFTQELLKRQTEKGFYSIRSRFAQSGLCSLGVEIVDDELSMRVTNLNRNLSLEFPSSPSFPFFRIFNLPVSSLRYKQISDWFRLEESSKEEDLVFLPIVRWATITQEGTLDLENLLSIGSRGELDKLLGLSWSENSGELAKKGIWAEVGGSQKMFVVGETETVRVPEGEIGVVINISGKYEWEHLPSVLLDPGFSGPVRVEFNAGLANFDYDSDGPFSSPSEHYTLPGRVRVKFFPLSSQGTSLGL